MKRIIMKGKHSEFIFVDDIIGNENSDREELVNYLNFIYYMTQYKDMDYRPEKYKWILGENIIYKLLSNITVINTHVKGELYGIQVEIDKENKDIIKLYRDMTSEIESYYRRDNEIS